MNNQWNPWQPGYYQYQQQPGPPYAPPQQYAPGAYWEQPAWNRPVYNEAPQGNGGGAYRSAKYPTLNPILASDTTLLRFDIRKKPVTDILQTTYYSNRYLPALESRAKNMRLISKAFPWAIDIVSPTPITCEMVWDALHMGLQEAMADSEWGILATSDSTKSVREKIEKSAKKRSEGAGEDGKYKRIDWLGETVFFKGLEKDADFEKLRSSPILKPCAETWIVKLSS
ncbi:hypothetical protein ONZ45_g10516 [Pleurotus djamor]|nr:hypothetical protein ONZ45_g10516 [Pleurotus djamor]